MKDKIRYDIAKNKERLQHIRINLNAIAEVIQNSQLNSAISTLDETIHRLNTVHY